MFPIKLLIDVIEFVTVCYDDTNSLLMFQAVLDCRRGPCIQFSENGGVSTFYFTPTNILIP